MFGHQDDDKSKKHDDENVAPTPAAGTDLGQQAPADDQPADSTAQNATTPTIGEQGADWQHPDTPKESANLKEAISPAGGFPKPLDYESFASGDENDDDGDEPTQVPGLTTSDTENSELVGIKQKALTELMPIIDKLDLPPEEKFRTIMMMIQASDNQDLVRVAYEAAHAITDEKAKAQALLDIVNEINYFTLPHDHDHEDQTKDS